MTGTTVREHAARFVDTGPHGKDDGGRMRCPVTGELCRGVLAHLCEDYGCARKGGLSPHPGENA